jgi:hypothetical protein
LQISQDLQDNEFIYFFVLKTREPSPRSCGPLLRAVHYGPRQWSGGALTGAHAPRRLWPRGLDVMAPQWSGGRGEPHHGQEAAAEARDFASDERGIVAMVEA